MLLWPCAGCGGDGLQRVPVHGKITAAGRPLDHATIQFLPADATKGEGSLGRSDADGNYTLTFGSRQGHSGVVAGAYKVRLSRIVGRDGSVLGPDAKQAENPGCKESIPEKYATLESALNVVVPDVGGVVNIDIPEPILGHN
jgi:hypothetical protein